MLPVAAILLLLVGFLSLGLLSSALGDERTVGGPPAEGKPAPHERPV